MKSLIPFLLIPLPCTSHAGYFVEKSMYVETYLAVGKGLTLEKAKQDAQTAIPVPTKCVIFEPNGKQNSPAFQCMGGGVWTEGNECLGNEVQYNLPLRKIEQ